MDAATTHQIRIALKTLRMPDAMVGIMGGMSKDEARKLLARVGAEIAGEYLERYGKPTRN